MSRIIRPAESITSRKIHLAGALLLLVSAAGCGSGEASTYDFDYCDQGAIRTATCTDGICDPAPFDDCGDGTCVLSPGACTKSQSYTYDYCDEGTIRTATCTGGLCDPAPFDDCGDGTCVLSPGACTKPQGHTYDYCDEGTIRTATCTDGLCDPAPFDDCGDGTCVLSPGTCPGSGTCGCMADEICVRSFDGTCTDLGHTCIKLNASCADDPCGTCADLLCGTSGIFVCDAAPPCSPPAEFDHACYGY